MYSIVGGAVIFVVLLASVFARFLLPRMFGWMKHVVARPAANSNPRARFPVSFFLVSNNYTVGDRVRVLWQGALYDAAVIKVNPTGEKIDVEYDVDGTVGKHLTVEEHGLKKLGREKEKGKKKEKKKEKEKEKVKVKVKDKERELEEKELEEKEMEKTGKEKEKDEKEEKEKEKEKEKETPVIAAAESESEKKCTPQLGTNTDAKKLPKEGVCFRVSLALSLARSLARFPSLVSRLSSLVSRSLASPLRLS